VFTKYQLVINHDVRRGFVIRANVGKREQSWEGEGEGCINGCRYKANNKSKKQGTRNCNMKNKQWCKAVNADGIT
jgi:hypothetical protein